MFLSSNLVSASEIHPYRLDSSSLHWKCASTRLKIGWKPFLKPRRGCSRISTKGWSSYEWTSGLLWPFMCRRRFRSDEIVRSTIQLACSHFHTLKKARSSAAALSQHERSTDYITMNLLSKSTRANVGILGFSSHDQVPTMRLTKPFKIGETNGDNSRQH